MTSEMSGTMTSELFSLRREGLVIFYEGLVKTQATVSLRYAETLLRTEDSTEDTVYCTDDDNY
jgi:hypothetical protein